jgi:acyl-homoserine-lactone acylase
MLICSLYVLSLLLSTAALSLVLPKPRIPTHHTAILWDTWGVPHIFAANNEGLFYAFGYAQMQNHADLLLSLYGQARGRAAEYWGPSYLGSDEFVRTMGFPERAKQWENAQTPEFQSYISAFVAGMNAYADDHPEQIDLQFKVVLPIQETDVFAHLERVLADFLLGNCSAVSGLLGAYTQGSGSAGSNGWAIGPAHSASKQAMLLANPHLSWGGDNTLFEAQLVSPSISVYGATLIGFPVLAIAFNNNLSWTHTVNTMDGCDGYELTLSGNGYMFDGQIRAFNTQRQTVLIQQSDGSMNHQQLVIRRSVQGPVFTEGASSGHAIAIRIVGVDQFPAYGIWQEWWDMGRAQSFQEFQSALQRLQIPMFTVIYADRAGNTFSLFNGEVPKHPLGDWNYWSNLVPGDTSKTLWTSLYPYSDLPKVINPSSGWVENSNSSPWYTTVPQELNPRNYPPDLAPQSLSLREQNGINMLLAQSQLSYEQMIADKFSSHVELADRVLDPLITAARTSGNDLIRRAVGVLQSWDRTADANDKGFALFYLWFLEVQQGNGPIFAVPWNPAQPFTTPSGLANPQAAVQALEGAAQKMLSLVGSLDVSWGSVIRLKRGHTNLPASGGPGDPFGIFRALYVNGQYEVTAGDSYIAAVQFSTPIQASVLLTYGNASQPDSPNNGDQLALYAHNQLRTAWLTTSQIKAHLASQEDL